MAIVYRADKGAPLTSEEVDGNFRELAQRLAKLETVTPAAESIGKIQVSGDQMTIIGDRGTEFGKFRLPTVAMHPCGKWKSGVAYAKYDVVCQAACAYVCVQAHTSKEFDKECKYWEVLLEGKND